MNVRVPDAGVLSKLVGFYLNLVGELASGSQDKNSGPIARVVSSLLNMHESWQKESTRFAGSCLRDSDQVPTFHGNGPGLRLDGRRLRESRVFNLHNH